MHWQTPPWKNQGKCTTSPWFPTGRPYWKVPHSRSRKAGQLQRRTSTRSSSSLKVWRPSILSSRTIWRSCRDSSIRCQSRRTHLVGPVDGRNWADLRRHLLWRIRRSGLRSLALLLLQNRLERLQGGGGIQFPREKASWRETPLQSSGILFPIFSVPAPVFPGGPIKNVLSSFPYTIFEHLLSSWCNKSYVLSFFLFSFLFSFSV